MRLIKPRDLIDLVALTVIFVLAGIVPEQYWVRFSRVLARLHVKILGYAGAHLGDLPDEQLGIRARDLELEFRLHNYLDLFEILRDYWPGGWNPKTTLVGEEHVKAALDKGKGAIIWICNLTRTCVPLYKAMSDAGYNRQAERFNPQARSAHDRFQAEFFEGLDCPSFCDGV